MQLRRDRPTNAWKIKSANYMHLQTAVAHSLHVSDALGKTKEKILSNY